MFSGIRRRWIISRLGLVFLIVLVVVTAYSIAAAQYYISGIRGSLESRVRTMSTFFNRYLNDNYNMFHTNAVRITEEFSDGDKLELQFIDASGRVVTSAMGMAEGTMAYTTDVTTPYKNAQPNTFIGIDPQTNERIISVSAPLLFNSGQVVGILRYVSSMRIVDRQILLSAGGAFLLGLLLTAFVGVSNLFFIRSLVLPLQEITEIAKKIASGSYGVKIERHFNDEIGELTDTINNMSMEISKAEKMKTDFISSVSHELRTPLTAIAGWGETLLSDDIRDIYEIKKGVRIMLKEANRLTKMVEELLDFTRMEGDTLRLQMEIMDLRAELEEVVYLYMDNLAREGIILTYNEADDIPPVMGDRARLRQVMLNLLDNAHKHGGDGKKIDIDLGTEEAFVIFTVRDYGQGIAAEELPHIKLKFYKGASKARGSGIGLALSDEIIRRHDGTLDIVSAPGEGACAIVRIPAHYSE